MEFKNYEALLAHVHTQLEEAGSILGIDYLTATPEEQLLLKDLANISPSNLNWFIRMEQPTGWTGSQY